jgi:hypothetical protein
MAKQAVSDWFIEQRTRSLATVYLTRRDDLLITEAPQESGLDLIVTIQARKGAPERKFGIILRGTRSDVTADAADDILQPTVEALDGCAYPYPVCLFLFCMESDRGYYTWIAEPLVTHEDSPVLRHRGQSACAELDTAAVNHIAVSVLAWYDAFYRGAPSDATGRRKATGIEVLHGIIDGEAAYFSEHRRPPALLKLPVLQAYELAKLGREHLGDLSARIVKDGVRVLEKDGLLGMRVKLVTDQPDFSFE